MLDGDIGNGNSQCHHESPQKWVSSSFSQFKYDQTQHGIVSVSISPVRVVGAESSNTKSIPFELCETTFITIRRGLLFEGAGNYSRAATRTTVL